MGFDFDEWFRRFLGLDVSPEGGAASRGRLLPLPDLSDATEAQLIGLARDYDGRVREVAVRELARFQTDAVFQALIERLNDWVAQVRGAAQTSLESFFNQECVGIVLRGLGAIMALQRRGRADHSGYLRRFTELLRAPEARGLVLRNVPACTGVEARYLLDLLSVEGGDFDVEVLRIFALHHDCAVRLKVVRLCRAKPVRHLSVLAELRHDAHPRVRAEILSIQWGLSDDWARAVLIQDALRDRAGSVREIAIWYARKTGFDLAAFANRALADPPAGNYAKVALIGLLTVLKMRAALEWVRSELMSDCATVRGAALTYLAALDRDACDVLVARALGDSSNKVARLARQLISRGQVALTHEQFITAVENQLVSGGTDRVFAICSLMSIWGRLEGLLMALQASQGSQALTRVLGELRRWERRQGNSAVRLDATERGRLLPLLDDSQVRDALSNERSLVFALQTTGLWV